MWLYISVLYFSFGAIFNYINKYKLYSFYISFPCLFVWVMTSSIMPNRKGDCDHQNFPNQREHNYYFSIYIYFDILGQFNKAHFYLVVDKKFSMKYWISVNFFSAFTDMIRYLFLYIEWFFSVKARLCSWNKLNWS